MENLIKVMNLNYWYGDSNAGDQVLKNINVSVEKGEFISIIGPNGCGKSTLIKHLNALLLPKSGKVIVDGLDTTEALNIPRIRTRVGMVFQNPDAQLFASVVEEDVAFGLENMCLPREMIMERVTQALEQVGMLEYRYHDPAKLSGGQRQKVAIAGVLAMRPECIILDEPTSMLDLQGRQEVLKAIYSLNRNKKVTIIYVTHDMSETVYFDRLWALNRGEVIYDGSPQGFFDNPELLKITGLRPPSIKILVEELLKHGIKIPRTIKTPQELVDAICQLM